MCERIKTPYRDINSTPIYTNDIIKHYNGMDLPWAYDIGIVHEDEFTGFCRTTLFPDHERFVLNEKCDYLVLGNLNDSPATIAVELWKSLYSEQKENYYSDTGIIGFLEEFRLTNDGEPLTTQEIEYALDEIERYNTELRHIY